MIPNNRREPVAPPIAGKANPVPGIPVPGKPLPLPEQPNIEADAPSKGAKKAPQKKRREPVSPEKLQKNLENFVEKMWKSNPAQIRNRWLWELQRVNSIAALLLRKFESLPADDPRRMEWEVRLILGKKLQWLQNNYSGKELFAILAEGRDRKVKEIAAKAEKAAVNEQPES